MFLRASHAKQETNWWYFFLKTYVVGFTFSGDFEKQSMFLFAQMFIGKRNLTGGKKFFINFQPITTLWFSELWHKNALRKTLSVVSFFLLCLFVDSDMDQFCNNHFNAHFCIFINGYSLIIFTIYLTMSVVVASFCLQLNGQRNDHKNALSGPRKHFSVCFRIIYAKSFETITRLLTESHWVNRWQAARNVNFFPFGVIFASVSSGLFSIWIDSKNRVFLEEKKKNSNEPQQFDGIFSGVVVTKKCTQIPGRNASHCVIVWAHLNGIT